MFRYSRKIVVLFLALIFACPAAAQTETLVAQILAKNSETERKKILENRSETELQKLVDDLLAESEKKSDAAECTAIVEIARQIADKINFKIGLAKTLFRFGVINFDKSPQTRSDFFARGIRLMEETGDQKELAKLLDSLGYIRTRTANFDEALEAYRRALEIHEKFGDTEASVRVLQGMGAVYMYLGDYNSAEAAHRRQLAIAEKMNLRVEISGALFHLGIINRLRGNYADALRLYQESKEISDTFAAENPKIYPMATTLRHIGGTYFLQGNLRLALDYANQALALDTQRKDEMATAYSLQLIAHIRVAEKNYTAALPVAEQTVEMFVKVGDGDGLARSLALVGNIYLSIGEYDKALENLNKALKMRQNSNSRDGIAAARIAIARVFLAQKKYADALGLAEKAAASARENGNREILWQAQSLIGQIYLAENECDKTRESFDAAIATIESLRGEIVGGAAENSLFFAERTKPYQLLAEMFAGQDDFNESFEYAERAKARVLLDSLRFGRQHQTAAMTAAEKQEENVLRNNVASLNAQISKTSDSQNLSLLKTKLEEARVALARFQTNLYAVHPELRIKRGAVKPIDAAEAGHLIDANDALLEYAVSDNQILLFVFTKSTDGAAQFKTYQISISRADLDKNVSRFRRSLGDRNILFASDARALYDLLLRPAQAQLKGKTKLTIVPDDGLWELPFQALQSAENHYVLDDASVSYAPSLTILREMRDADAAAKNSAKESALLAFGNPTGATAKIVNTNFTALPEAEKQTLALRNLYGAANVRVFNRGSADESVFKQATQKEFQILHLATHGVLDNNSPLNSYVLLAPNEAAGEDGRLEAWEILEMNLDADLVFLSACETARGQTRSGEGLIGLSWSLMVAGAKNVAVSQWKVESSSTTDLTVEFYKNLKQTAGAKKTEALRQAELKLRRNSLTAHPFYWAGFVLIGEGN